MASVPTTDADRMTATLRLVIGPIVLVGETVASAAPDPGEIVDEDVVLLAVGLIVYALAVRVLVRGRTRPRVLDRVTPLLDIAFAVALGFASGGPFSFLSLVFLFAPAATAFQLRPRLTALTSAISIAAFFLHGAAHPSSGRPGALAELVARTIYISWGGGVLVALSALLARREARLQQVLAERRLLVRERLGADDRARTKIARDLHDGVLQSILAVRLTLTAGAGDDRSRDHLVDVLGQVVADMRGLIGELHPRVLEQVGLQAALTSLLRGAGERSPGIDIASTLIDDLPGGPHDEVLYRAAVELVSNVASHARATRMALSLRADDGWRVLVVEDDGVGLDRATLPARLEEGHIGLLSLDERVQAVGGNVVMTAAVGGGLVVTVSVPVERSHNMSTT